MCQHANYLNLLVFIKSCQKSTFITDGFGHWVKALIYDRNDVKNMKNTHKEAVTKIATLTNSISISTRLNEQHASSQRHVNEGP